MNTSSYRPGQQLNGRTLPDQLAATLSVDRAIQPDSRGTASRAVIYTTIAASALVAVHIDRGPATQLGPVTRLLITMCAVAVVVYATVGNLVAVILWGNPSSGLWQWMRRIRLTRLNSRDLLAALICAAADYELNPASGTLAVSVRDILHQRHLHHRQLHPDDSYTDTLIELTEQWTLHDERICQAAARVEHHNWHQAADLLADIHDDADQLAALRAAAIYDIDAAAAICEATRRNDIDWPIVAALSDTWAGDTASLIATANTISRTSAHT